MKLVLPGVDVALGGSNGSFPISTRRSSELFTKLYSGRMRQRSKVGVGDSNYMWGEKLSPWGQAAVEQVAQGGWQPLSLEVFPTWATWFEFSTDPAFSRRLNQRLPSKLSHSLILSHRMSFKPLGCLRVWTVLLHLKVWYDDLWVF